MKHVPKDWPRLVVLDGDRSFAKKMIKICGRETAFKICQEVDKYVGLLSSDFRKIS